MGKTIATLFFAAAVIVAGPGGCSREGGEDASGKREKIVMAVTPWPGSASLYVAQEEAYFKNRGLDVTFHSYLSGHQGLDAVLSGQADVATAGDTPIARAAIEGKPVMVIATLCDVDRAIVIVARKDRGISSAKDLVGKKVGVVKGTTADFFLNIFLTTSYIYPGKVRITNLAPDEVVDALVKGEVDAVSTWSPHTIVAARKLGDNAVILDDPAVYRMTWNIITSREFVTRYPERIRKVLAAIVTANEFIDERPGDAQALCLKYMGADGSIAESEWETYGFTATLDESLILNLEDQARWMIKSGAGDGPIPNFMNFIYTDGLKAVRLEAVGITGN
jgi:ABC-type nitrate/sulfonate/bicarbonate transport system substrate-binding protein